MSLSAAGRMSRNRRRIERELATSPKRWLFSPAYYSQYRITLPLILEHIRGDRVLDLGCGEMPMKSIIEDMGVAYDGLDISGREGLSYVADIQDLSLIPEGSYDFALCLEVLEHVPDPWKAMREIHRILRPGGKLVLSVPHLSRIHDAPNDYYRFTEYGLRELAQSAGFEILSLSVRGGLVSFLGHQASSLLLTSVWSLPIIRPIIWTLNAYLITHPCFFLDQRLSRLSRLFPMGFTMVTSKHAS